VNQKLLVAFAHDFVLEKEKPRRKIVNNIKVQGKVVQLLWYARANNA